MDFLKHILESPFTWGFALGMIFCVLALWSHWGTRREFQRYRKHLGDKLDLEARSMEQSKTERERLAAENENLRIKVASLLEKPERRLERDLEIYARAEKEMMINAPGFAPAWEMSKSRVLEELKREESGASKPVRLFQRLFSGPKDASGDNSATQSLLTDHSETGMKKGTAS